PIEAAWLGGEAMDNAWESLREVCGALHSRQVAFEFIDARALMGGTVADEVLETPGQLFGTVIVPNTRVMPVGALERLAELRECGSRVAFCGALPELPADFDASPDFERARERLAADRVEMDETGASRSQAGDAFQRLGRTLTFDYDGFTAALLGPRQSSLFTQQEMAEGACLIVPEEELVRLAEMLALVIGRYELQLDEPRPELSMASRAAGDYAVHFMLNESDAEIRPRLMLVSDRPREVLLWDTLTSRQRVIAVHDEVSEPTYFTVPLGGWASALVITRPLGDARAGAAAEPSLLRITSEVRAQSIEVVREAVITTAGDLEVREHAYTPRHLPADFPLKPLEEMGMADFSGTVRYHVDLYVPPGDVGRRLFLDLGEVGCVARAWLNGEELGESAWPPHRVEISGLVEANTNELIVEVTNTLANQAGRDDVVEMARERGWTNAYYERTLPWMRQGRRSGLIGPVQVLRDYS
ncbi:MAG: hypothetical protein ACP5KN_14655, partial [Armatimonadota bacterium]